MTIIPLVSVHVKVTSAQSGNLRSTVSADEVRDPPMPGLGENDESGEVHVRSKVSAKLLQDLAPVRGAVYCLPSPIDDKACVLLHDTLKILFNQTLGWVNEDCEGVSSNSPTQ